METPPPPPEHKLQEHKPAQEHTEHHSDWEISDLYSQAWAMITKYKVLWIFGIATGAASYSSNSGGNSNLNTSDVQNIQKMFQQQPQTQEHASALLTQVLGASTSSLADTFHAIVGAIPLYFYVLLAIEFLLLILVSVVITYIYKAWAEGALLSGIQMAYKGLAPTMRDSSERSFRSIPSLLWLNIIPSLVFILLLIPIIALLIVPLLTTRGDPLMMIVFVVVMIIVVVTGIYLSLSLLWASRIVVIEEKSAFTSLKLGYNIMRRKFWSMALLGIVNFFVSLAAMIVPIVVIIFIVGFGIILFIINKNFLIPLIIAFVPVLIAALFAFTLIEGIINSFKYAVWTIAYNKIRGKYDK